MITVFERIPNLFVELYDAQLQTWAREFRARGKRCAVLFEQRPGDAVVYDREERRIMKGAWLTAEVDRSRPATPRVIIRPATEHDEELIARHVSEMKSHVLQ